VIALARVALNASTFAVDQTVKPRARAHLLGRLPRGVRTAGLIESSPPLWRWGVALSLAALTTAAALKVAPKLVSGR